MATENDPVLIALMRRAQNPGQQEPASDDDSGDSGHDTLAACGQDIIDAVRNGDADAVGSALQTAVEAILGRSNGR